MSIVTDVLVLSRLSGFPRDTEEALRTLGFKEVSDCAGGNKHVQGEVWLGAWNFLEEAPMRAALQAMDWGGTVVRFFYSRENDERWYEFHEAGFDELPFGG